MNEELKVLDNLRKLCMSAMLLVDDFVKAHKDILVELLRKEFDIPDDWQVKILCNCGVVTGSFRPDDTSEWKCVIYNDMKWWDLI